MIMMALLHMTGLENSECIWKNPAQSGSGCIHFNNIIISLEINLFSRSLWYRWKFAELALNNNHSLTRIFHNLFSLFNKKNWAMYDLVIEITKFRSVTVRDHSLVTDDVLLPVYLYFFIHPFNVWSPLFLVYNGPSPPIGEHRYQLLLLEQTGKIKTNTIPTERGKFKLEKFLSDNNLCDLVAGFQYRVKANVWMNDDIPESVNITREMLLKYYIFSYVF